MPRSSSSITAPSGRTGRDARSTPTRGSRSPAPSSSSGTRNSASRSPTTIPAGRRSSSRSAAPASWSTIRTTPRSARRLLASRHWKCVWFDPIVAVFVHDSYAGPVARHTGRLRRPPLPARPGHRASRPAGAPCRGEGLAQLREFLDRPGELPASARLAGPRLRPTDRRDRPRLGGGLEGDRTDRVEPRSDPPSRRPASGWPSTRSSISPPSVPPTPSAGPSSLPRATSWR